MFKKYLLAFISFNVLTLPVLTLPVFAQRIHPTQQNEPNAIYPAGETTTQTTAQTTKQGANNLQQQAGNQQQKIQAVNTNKVYKPKVVAPEMDFNPDAPNSLPLTADEQEAISRRQRWSRSVAVSPFVGGQGAIQFVYGAQDPTIVCAVREVCDIALQHGEQLNSISVGDATRWNVVPAITGTGDNETEHLIIKPLSVGSETSMVVTTDRRTYHFLLHSHATTFMPYVSFSYPEDMQIKLAALKAKEQKERQDRTIPETGEYLGNLNFNYCLKGHAEFKPVRVYDDGVKTIIQFPTAVPVTDAPVLLVDSPFAKSPGLVNSRLQSNRLIVDKIFSKAVLIAGVGGHQQKITIYRGGC